MCIIIISDIKKFIMSRQIFMVDEGEITGILFIKELQS